MKDNTEVEETEYKYPFAESPFADFCEPFYTTPPRVGDFTATHTTINGKGSVARIEK